jgi:hypothetical protein
MQADSNEMNSSTHSFNGGFATARWSMVVAHDQTHPTTKHTALIELCLGYWYPVYAFLRRCGHAPDTAQGIARAFEQHMINSSKDGLRPLANERFRDFLLKRLHMFLAGNWHELAINEDMPEGPAREELEQRNQIDNAGTQTPEEAFQVSFASEVIARALERLRAEAEANGHLDMYEVMLPYVSREPGPGEYEELAIRLRSRPLTLVIALKRLRQRFRELVGNELTDTVENLDGLIEEQKTLHDFLRKPN